MVMIGGVRVGLEVRGRKKGYTGRMLRRLGEASRNWVGQERFRVWGGSKTFPDKKRWNVAGSFDRNERCLSLFVPAIGQEIVLETVLGEFF